VGGGDSIGQLHYFAPLFALSVKRRTQSSVVELDCRTSSTLVIAQANEPSSRVCRKVDLHRTPDSCWVQFRPLVNWEVGNHNSTRIPCLEIQCIQIVTRQGYKLSSLFIHWFSE